MGQVVVNIPDEAASLLHLAPEEIEAEVRLAAAIKLYEVGRLSSGAAAALAGLPRAVFLSKLAEYNVPTFRLSETELQEDLSRA
jgi:predicted HTH domain antitoxin